MAKPRSNDGLAIKEEEMHKAVQDFTAEMIHEKYKAAYGQNIQGCCLLIADEIQQTVGGEVVAGELTWYGGSCRRTHWWVEKDGTVIDPMGDEFLSTEEYTGREEAHRDRTIFDGVLPQYEQWRI
jgi:hypothetical protein